MAAAAATGLAIALVDSRPTWDDTALTAVMLFMAAAAFALVGRRRPWLWAFLVGAWVPALEMTGPAGAASLLGPVFALAGAGLGSGLGRGVRPSDQFPGQRPS